MRTLAGWASAYARAKVEPQDVLCIDENQVRVRSKTMFEPDRALGKFEHVDLGARPTTSVVRAR